MSSFLDGQISAFKSSVSSSSSKLAIKRTVSDTASRTATPSLQNQTPSGDLKRKHPDQNVTYSQPQNTGTGENIMTQVTFAIDYLKSKRTPQTFDAIFSYLSVAHQEQKHARTLEHILKSNPKVRYEHGDNGKKDTFQFRPFQDISSKETLLAYLQGQRTAQGLNIKDLREGWPEVLDAINELTAEGKLLVVRNAKDDIPKTVWANDPSLSAHLDPEFKTIWKQIRLPEPKEVVAQLREAGLQPADKSGPTNLPVKQESKKTKKPRRGGKTTNTHMAGVLRDYSHLKK